MGVDQAVAGDEPAGSQMRDCRYVGHAQREAAEVNRPDVEAGNLELQSIPDADDGIDGLDEGIGDAVEHAPCQVADLARYALEEVEYVVPAVDDPVFDLGEGVLDGVPIL